MSRFIDRFMPFQDIPFHCPSPKGEGEGHETLETKRSGETLSAEQANIVRVCLRCGLPEFDVAHIDLPYTHHCIYPNTIPPVDLIDVNVIQPKPGLARRAREVGAGRAEGSQ
jgi:hypothetical protein